jgi:hypothetical protein
MSRNPSLPTYRTAAAVLEGHTGSGVRLAGWTLARMFLIGPPMMLVGVPAKQAFIGAALASGLISSLTLLRIFHGQQTGLAGLTRARPRPSHRGRHVAVAKRSRRG